MTQTELAPSNSTQLSVSELTSALKKILEDRFGYVRVRGEISGYRGPHASGHAYFSLKDEGARLDAVVWRTSFLRMKVKPQEGLEVIASGRITTFAGKSTYQIIVESLEPAGAGALMALLEERRRRLAAEGVFDAQRKRPLPFLPRVIGVVTSPDGSVIRDVLHRLGDRFPAHVLIWPVRVQGDNAAEEVAAGIRGLNALPIEGPIARPDVLIVARGGGSLEDLWAFNEEIVVRAAGESAIPLISAVGHETDWTLIDHAADVRAPTPTAAAEFCVPVRSELLLRTAQLQARAIGSATRVCAQQRAHLRLAARALPSRKTLFASLAQRLDMAADRLKARLREAATFRGFTLSRLASRLDRQFPLVLVARAAERVRALGDSLKLRRQSWVDARRAAFSRVAVDLRFLSASLTERRTERLRLAAERWRSRALGQAVLLANQRRHVVGRHENLARAVLQRLERRRGELAHASQVFAAVNHGSVLARGYALILDPAGATVTRVEEAKAAGRLTVRFHDGDVEAAVGRKSPGRGGARTKGAEKQPTLF